MSKLADLSIFCITGKAIKRVTYGPVDWTGGVRPTLKKVSTPKQTSFDYIKISNVVLWPKFNVVVHTV